jgi:hypothetical protein
MIDKENRDKMIRNYEPTEPKTEQPLLIEEVIDKANDYRKNNRLLINQS